jgi:hypothetical protein
LLNILRILFACTSSSSISMILRFGLLMELVSSYIFLSQVLSCMSNTSSVFPLISISFSSSEILCSACSSLLSVLPMCFVFLFPFFIWSFPYHWCLTL